MRGYHYVATILLLRDTIFIEQKPASYYYLNKTALSSRSHHFRQMTRNNHGKRLSQVRNQCTIVRERSHLNGNEARFRLFACGSRDA